LRIIETDSLISKPAKQEIVKDSLETQFKQDIEITPQVSENDLSQHEISLKQVDVKYLTEAHDATFDYDEDIFADVDERLEKFEFEDVLKKEKEHSVERTPGSEFKTSQNANVKNSS